MLTSKQNQAIERWKQRQNIAILAVPGAGKSRVLVETCRTITDGFTLLLAYNHSLAEDTNKRLTEAGLHDTVICKTFHALCQTCMDRPIFDDIALHDAIEAAEEGKIEVTKLHNIKYVLIDEAQDFKRSFYRLIGLVCNLDEVEQYMIVGDEKQMLYDYDEDDPAELEFLTDAPSRFRNSREWNICTLNETHRLSPQITAFVNAVFDTKIVSRRDAIKGTPVCIYTVNLWRAGPIVLKTVVQVQDVRHVTILVSKKKNNGPLRALVNYLSTHGQRVHIHGFDGQDDRTKDSKLCISSWHAAKGTENETIIVFGAPNDDNTNPFYVALTRSTNQLVVIQDAHEPNEHIIRALRGGLDPMVYTLDTETVRLVQTPRVIEKAKRGPLTDRCISIDNWHPNGNGRWIRDMLGNLDGVHGELPQREEAEVVEIGASFEDVGQIYLLSALMRAEYESSGRIRRIEDMLWPIRATREVQQLAIVNGSSARFVSTHTSESALIAPSCLSKCMRLYTHTSDNADFGTMACIAHAWSSYHHILRQLHPVSAWFDVLKFEKSYEFLCAQLKPHQNDLRFDRRLLYKHKDGIVLYARCDFVSSTQVWHCVWDAVITHAHRIDAAILASMHEMHCVTVLNLRTQTAETLNIAHPATLLDRVYEQCMSERESSK